MPDIFHFSILGCLKIIRRVEQISKLIYYKAQKLIYKVKVIQYYSNTCRGLKHNKNTSKLVLLNIFIKYTYTPKVYSAAFARGPGVRWRSTG